jgi:5-methylcytosine-specific restriction protein A
MPYDILRPCLEPRCPALVPHGRCPAHERTYDRQRGTARERGYTSRWDEYSKARLQRYPLCGQRQDGLLYPEHSQCAKEGRTVAAQCTDHIVAVHKGGSMWDESNHQSLCLACNSRKANELEGGFGR